MEENKKELALKYVKSLSLSLGFDVSEDNGDIII
jgi:hypothetical protein